MKSTYLRMAAVALTMWLGFAAGTANAITYINDWTFVAPNTYTASFGNDSIAASSSFDNWFDFSLPASALGTGSQTVFGATTAGLNVFFTAFNLFEDTLGLVATGSFCYPNVCAYSSFSGGLVPGSYHLNVAGYNTDPSNAGSYAGTINVAAVVAEPETYAMLLAGLGLVGFSARRRFNNNGMMNNA